MTPQEAVERALAMSSAEGCIVIASEESQANLRWANNTLTTNGETRDRSLSVISIVDGTPGTAAGVVQRSNVDADTIEALVRASEQAARNAGPAEDAMPLVGPDALGDVAGDFDAPAAATSIGVFADFAPALGQALEEAGAADRHLYGFAQHSTTTTYLASSTGLRARFDQPEGMVSVTGKSADGTRSAWRGQGTRDFTDVDVPGLAASLAQRLEWSKRRIDLPAGRYETLLPPDAVADLMIYLYWSAGARDAHDGRTVFSKPGGGTRVGDMLGNVPVTLRSDPAYPGLQCSPFNVAPASGAEASVFDNGLPLSATDWVSEGRLAALLQTRYSSQITGLPTTPMIGNLILRGPDGGRSVDEMVASTERGLLLTCLWYIREVDPQTLLLTGLTRDGVYLVEGGEVVGAVNNFRFNESPVDLLGRLAEVGGTELCLSREWSDWFTRTAMPALRIGDFNMSTVSQAS
jgi:predicted Zn-dependent protease